MSQSAEAGTAESSPKGDTEQHGDSNGSKDNSNDISDDSNSDAKRDQNNSDRVDAALADLDKAEELVLTILETADATVLELANIPNCNGDVLKELVSLIASRHVSTNTNTIRVGWQVYCVSARGPVFGPKT
jgi:hypothetical protein